MKKHVLLIPLFAFIFCFSNSAEAQNYQTALGARLGYPLAISFKHFLNENSAIEAYVGTRWYSTYRWTNISGAYLYHKPIAGLDGLQWYVGGGASAYFWGFKNTFPGAERYNNTTIGIQGYLGLDYKFDDVPINISLDWVPTYFFNGFGNGFGAGYGSLAVRYVLK
ncbi:MAG: hypothetical protein DHS20C18_50930 [Saprospiraceae bacterium]|nr:MAG: hypothetical protein DHS20C18_50930 [Saprospiraceae bacterium]